MAKCKFHWLVLTIASGSILSACSHPVGDFGRLDTSASEAIKVQPVLSGNFKNPIYKNPINFSKTEKKFRLTAILLQKSAYSGNIKKFTALNHFNAKGPNKISERHQTIINKVRKLHNILHEFQKLTTKVKTEDSQRQYLHKNDAKYIKGLNLRRAKNKALTQKVARHLAKLHIAYVAVIDHGDIVEPNLSSLMVREKLRRFSLHVDELAAVYY